MLSTLRSLVTSLAIASTVGSVAQAYASSTTQVSASSATARTSGIAVEAIDYQANGSVLQAVKFQVNQPTVSLSIRLRTDGAWIHCENRAGEVTCPTEGFPVGAVDQLEIVTN
jgi:hypothetical protein